MEAFVWLCVSSEASSCCCSALALAARSRTTLRRVVLQLLSAVPALLRGGLLLLLRRLVGLLLDGTFCFAFPFPLARSSTTFRMLGDKSPLKWLFRLGAMCAVGGGLGGGLGTDMASSADCLRCSFLEAGIFFSVALSVVTRLSPPLVLTRPLVAD